MLDGTSGLITGTPRAARTLTPYTITASSVAGNTSFVLVLTVVAALPRSEAMTGAARSHPDRSTHTGQRRSTCS
jgi:hypothetical protein